MPGRKKRKLWKWLAILTGIPVLLVVLLSLVLMLVVDKEMVIGKFEAALNRHITVGEASAGIFSVVSGLKARDIRISNFKTAEQLKNAKGKAVSADDLFLSIKYLALKVKLLPLLSKRIELKELTVQDPVLHVIQFNSDSANISDLLGDASTKEAKPLTIDDLALGMSLEKIKLTGGTLDFENRGLRQTTRVYDFEMGVPSLEIDPADLMRKNRAEIGIRTALKSLGEYPDSGFRSFDLLVAGLATIRPFSPQTRRFDPELSGQIQSTRGQIKGVKMLASIKRLSELTRYCDRLDFIKEDLEWEKGSVDIALKQGWLTFANGNIYGKDMHLSFAGKSRTGDGMLDLDLGILLAARYTPELRSGIWRNVNSLLSGNIKKHVSVDMITDQALKIFVNPEGRIFLEFKVSGALGTPHPKLVRPQLPALEDLIQAAARDYLEKNKGQLLDQGQKLLNKLFRRR